MLEAGGFEGAGVGERRVSEGSQGQLRQQQQQQQARQQQQGSSPVSPPLGAGQNRMMMVPPSPMGGRPMGPGGAGDMMPPPPMGQHMFRPPPSGGLPGQMGPPYGMPPPMMMGGPPGMQPRAARGPNPFAAVAYSQQQQAVSGGLIAPQAFAGQLRQRLPGSFGGLGATSEEGAEDPQHPRGQQQRLHRAQAGTSNSNGGDGSGGSNKRSAPQSKRGPEQMEPASPQHPGEDRTNPALAGLNWHLGDDAELYRIQMYSHYAVSCSDSGLAWDACMHLAATVTKAHFCAADAVRREMMPPPPRPPGSLPLQDSPAPSADGSGGGAEGTVQLNPFMSIQHATGAAGGHMAPLMQQLKDSGGTLDLGALPSMPLDSSMFHVST
jgi:hypothetical protein